MFDGSGGRVGKPGRPWASTRWVEYERICQLLDNATRDVAGMARALLELNDETSGHPA
jgi:hypothetical protein